MWTMEEMSSTDKKTQGWLNDENHIINWIMKGGDMREIYNITPPEKSSDRECIIERVIYSWKDTLEGYQPTDVEIIIYKKGKEVYWEPLIERNFKLDVIKAYEPVGTINQGYIDGRRHHLGINTIFNEMNIANNLPGYLIWLQINPTK